MEKGQEPRRRSDLDTRGEVSKTKGANGEATRWSGAGEGAISAGHYFVLAGFVATLGIFVGAPGASFERYLYFRHLAYVDEET